MLPASLSEFRKLRHGHTLRWLLLLIAVCAQTYPLILNLSSGIYGYAGDSVAAIIRFSQLAHSIRSPAAWHSLRYSRPVVDAAGALLATAAGPVVAYNLLILSGYVATAVATYLLAMHITRNREAALLAAFLFTFCPYRLLHSYGHLHLSLTQWLPLYVLCMLRLRERTNWWRALQLALILLLLSLSSFYYAYFAALLFLPITAALLLHPAPRRRQYILYALCSLAPCTAGAAVLFRNRVVGVFLPDEPAEKLIHDLFTYSARPLEYLIPHASSLWRPIVLPFWRNNLHGSNEVEQALFLGAVPLALAAFAVAAAFRRRTVLWPVALAGAIFLSAIALSAPPAFTVAGLQVTGPSLVLARLVPSFRVYARMGILAYLGLALLAAVGWKVVTNRRQRRSLGLLWSLLVLAVLLEYTNVPPFRFLSLKPPPVHEWLRGVHGSFSVVEFPLPPEPRSLADRRVYFSMYHGKKSLTHLREVDLGRVMVLDRETVRAMAAQGVRYVIVHLEPLDMPRDILIHGTPVVAAPHTPDITADSGLVLVRRDAGALVYEIAGCAPGP
jgi:hypothetical protein